MNDSSLERGRGIIWGLMFVAFGLAVYHPRPLVRLGAGTLTAVFFIWVRWAE